MSERLRNYTCADPDMASSPPIKTTRYQNPSNASQSLAVQWLLDSDNAKIWTIDNFITGTGRVWTTICAASPPLLVASLLPVSRCLLLDACLRFLLPLDSRLSYTR
jgi:hypothetical protein